MSIARFTAMMAGLVLAGLAAPSYPALAQSDTRQPGWRAYADERTGTQVDFPAALFPVDGGEPERGTGRIFKSEDGRATFSAYALENEDSHTPQSYLRRFLKVDPRSIDYRRVTRNFFAVSGVRDGEVYYSRCNFHRRIHCIYMSYPQHELRAWDRIVTRVSLSLRVPRERTSQRD